MADLTNIVMFVAASLGSLALGVLSAYGVLRFGFSLMRPRQKPLVEVSVSVAQV